MAQFQSSRSMLVACGDLAFSVALCAPLQHWQRALWPHLFQDALEWIWARHKDETGEARPAEVNLSVESLEGLLMDL